MRLRRWARPGCAARSCDWPSRPASYHATCPGLPPHPSYIEHLLSQADQQAREGKIDEALAAYTAAQQLNPHYQVGAEHWNALCWDGALWGQVKDVLEACGTAVALAPSDGDYHDSRGLARPLTGDTTGAVEDFEAFIAWEKQQQEPDTNAITQRQQWIADLKAGRQPFDKATLEQLREQ